MRAMTSEAWKRCRTLMTPIMQIETRFNSGRANTQILSPRAERFGSSVRGNQSVASSVPALLFLRSPSHIAAFVMAAYINSVKRVTRSRFVADFIQKFRHIGKTKLYPTSSPISISRIVRILAPTFSGMVGEKFSRRLSIERFAVRDAAFAGSFVTKAPARATQPTSEALAVNHAFGSTFAFAVPSRAAVLGFTGKRNNLPAVKGLVGKVDHACNYSIERLQVITIF